MEVHGQIVICVGEDCRKRTVDAGHLQLLGDLDEIGAADEADHDLLAHVAQDGEHLGGDALCGGRVSVRGKRVVGRVRT